MEGRSRVAKIEKEQTTEIKMMKQAKEVITEQAVPRVTVGELSERLGLSRTTLFDMAKEGRLPTPVNVTGSQKPLWRWFATDIEAWLSDRKVRSGYKEFRPEYLEN